MSSLRINLRILCAVLTLVLIGTDCQVANAQVSWKRGEQGAAPPAALKQLRVDRKVVGAGLEVGARSPSAEADSPAEAAAVVADPRLLAPPTRAQIASPVEGGAGGSPRVGALAVPRIESFTTAGAGLAIVVGLFLVCAWLLRRSGPKATTPLPSEAVAVLGRVPLAARNFAHLLQVGNKLVLVAITPEGVSPITEVTDPAEVQRMLGLCLRNHKHSTTAEFHTVLEKLSKEPASGFLENEVLGNQTAASNASQGKA